MAALTGQRVSLSGTIPTYAAASAGGDTAPVGSGVMLSVRNGGAGAVTVTVDVPTTMDGLTVSDAVVTVPAGGSAFVPMADIFRQPTGVANITYSAVASVTVAVIQH